MMPHPAQLADPRPVQLTTDASPPSPAHELSPLPAWALVAVPLVIILAAILWARHRRSPRAAIDRAFRRLTRDLSPSDRAALRLTAEAARLHPAALALSDGALIHAARLAAANDPASLHRLSHVLAARNLDLPAAPPVDSTPVPTYI